MAEQPVPYNRNSMCIWWPMVEHVKVPKPRTTLVDATEWYDQLWRALDGGPMPDALLERIRQAAHNIGYPCFVRGDLTSGKHDYPETCLLDRPERTGLHVAALVEAGAMGPGDVPRAFAVRELLSLRAPFVAFHGLPIANEYRFFVRDGKILCEHFYWPTDSIRFWSVPEPKGWADTLAFSLEDGWPPPRHHARKVAKTLPGFWSLDFAQSVSGDWYFIDAATGEDSWHWPGCPKSTDPAAEGG